MARRTRRTNTEISTFIQAWLDSATTRFGVRSIAVDGHKLLLNGQRIFLAGYGDDAIYPMTVSPPRDKSAYVQKLRFAHEHGFVKW